MFCVFKGVESERCASFYAALKAGKPINTPAQPTLADGSFLPATNFIVVLECCYASSLWWWWIDDDDNNNNNNNNNVALIITPMRQNYNINNHYLQLVCDCPTNLIDRQYVSSITVVMATILSIVEFYLFCIPTYLLTYIHTHIHTYIHTFHLI